MDSKRFDTWTRKRALRLSRRDALRLVGAGGGMAALASIAPSALAQSTCTLTIHAETSGGPSAPSVYDGALEFTLESDGSLTGASFTSSGGTERAVTGHTTGRAVDFQIDLGSDQVLSFSGAGAEQLTTCQGDAAGIFSGPQLGDLGGWQLTAASTPSAPSIQSSQSSQSSTPSGQGSSLSCPPPRTACGPICCPEGTSCIDANFGLCSCPAGTVRCNDVDCVAECSDGETLDETTCTCRSRCVENNSTCSVNENCCSGYCAGGTCFDCAGIVCAGFGCVDPNRDPAHCGACFTPCSAPQVCTNGFCGCGPDGTLCALDNECCSQACLSGVCGKCFVGDTNCGGYCSDLARDAANCGTCGYVCPQTWGSVICRSGICRDINNDPNFCGSGEFVCQPGQICYLGVCANP